MMGSDVNSLDRYLDHVQLVAKIQCIECKKQFVKVRICDHASHLEACYSPELVVRRSTLLRISHVLLAASAAPVLRHVHCTFAVTGGEKKSCLFKE